MHEAINNNDWMLLQSLISENVDKIFIGTYSDGYKFKFNCHTFQYYNPNIESLYEFLKSGIIEDEYGDAISFNDFMDKINETYDNPNNMDLMMLYHNPKNIATYTRYYPKIRKCIQKAYKEKFDIDVNELGEFYIDKYRFGIDD